MMKIKFLHFLILFFAIFTSTLTAQNSLAVTVFEDIEGNGLHDGADVTINGITTAELRLFHDLDNSGTINVGDIEYMHDGGVGGVYTFGTGNILLDAQYILEFVEVGLPGNYYVTDMVNGVGLVDMDNDLDPASNTAVFSLLGDTPEMLIDVGLVLPGQLGNLVWEDINGDGLTDGELGDGIDGVTVTLLYDDFTAANDIDGNPVAPVITAGGGAYSFTHLDPGPYILEFTLPAPNGINPWFATTPNLGDPDFANDSDIDKTTLQTGLVTVMSNIIDNNIDAGFYQAVRIGDFVWEDLDGNGVQDGGGEVGIDGVTVSLIDNMGNPANGADGTPVLDQVTAGGGLYQFVDIAPGDYQVEFSLPAPVAGVAWYPTEFDPGDVEPDDSDLDSDASNNPADGVNYLRTAFITVESNETDEETRIDAGFWRTATIGDMVFCDVNGNGIDDDGMGVGGVDVNLVDAIMGTIALDADGNNLTTTSDGAGMYSFDLVPPGTYFIQFVFTGSTPNPPFVFTQQDIGGDMTDSDVDPNTGETADFVVISGDTEEEEKWDAGVYQTINVFGTIWTENDGNSMYDVGEIGPGGVMLEIFDANSGGKVDETFTNAGDYEFFGLPPGDYYIQYDVTGTALESATSCPGQNDANDMVDNDDNGNDDAIVITTVFTLESNCDPNNPPQISYIDFCYFFDCNEPNLLAATACADIVDPNIICDISILGTFCNLMPDQDSPGNQPNPLCPDGGAPHNISWFAFVAYGGDYSVTVTPTGCSGSTTGVDGVQIGLYTDCTFTESVYCDPGCNLNPVTFDSDILEEGQTYYFFIDGCSSSVCSYEVVLDGNPIAPNLVPDDVCIDNNGSLECEDATYCPDALVTFVATDFDLTVDFTWSITTVSGTTYSGDPNPMTETEMLELVFPDEGVYEVCLNQVDNGCSAQQWNGNECIQITIEGIDDEMFDDQIICEEDLMDFDLGVFDPDDPNSDGTSGWQATGTNVDFGTVTGTVTTPEGCIYEQEFELMMHPESEQGLLEMTICKEELPFNVDAIELTELSFAGTLIFDLQDYLLTQSADENGCDSIADIEIELLDLIGGAFDDDLVCIQEGIIMNFNYLDGISTDAEFITFEWFDPNDNLLDDTWNPLNPLDNVAPVGVGSGTYTLIATIDKNGKVCTFMYTIDIDFDDFLPPNPSISGPGLSVCEADSIVTYTAMDFGDAFEFEWDFPSDVASSSTSGGFGEVLTINWSGSAGGSVTLISANGCGESELIEIEITVVPQPTPNFDFVNEVCVDSCSTIEFMGDASNIASFDWDFAGGTESNGTGGTGPGPHCVSWTDEGDKIITLSYTDNDGCVSKITTDTITVTPPITPPVVNCNPATGEVSFTWDDVPGNLGYEVEVTSTSDITGDLHTGTLDGTTFTVTGLEEGETVTIILTIFTDDACQMVSIASPGCTSQDCIAPSINLMSDVMSFCLDPTSGTATITADVTSGETGSGQFSGPGIVDPDAGTFDPDSANIGLNTITYVFMTDDAVPCIGNQTIQIEVLETPTASFFSDLDTICVTEQLNITYDGTANANAFTWNYGADGTGTGGANPTVDFTTPGLKTIELIVEKDGCTSEAATIEVFVQPELEQVQVNCSIQEIDQVEFSWNAVDGATGYLITINGGAPFMTTDNSYGETGLSPDDMVTITVTVLTDSRCPGSTDDQTCTAVSCPSFTFSYDNPVQDICVDGTNALIDLQADASGGTGTGTYSWSGTNVIGDQFDPNGLPEGSYEVFVTYQEDACEDSGSVMINITTTPTAAFSVDNTTICVGETVNILYEGSQLTDQVITWTSGGENVVAGTNTDEYLATFNQTGTFDIELDVVNGACTTTTAIESITVEPELVFDTITCVEELDMIVFSWMTVDCASEYEVFIDGVSQGTQTNTDFTVPDLAVGQEVTIEVIAVSGCACGNVMTTRICEAKECTVVDLGLSTMNGVQEFCFANDLQAVEIIAETVGSEGNGTFVWSGPGVDQNGMFDPVAAGVGTHTIYFDFMESPGCPYQDSITFIINDIPAVDQQFEELSCFDQLTTNLEIIPSGGDGNYTITLNNEDGDLMNEVEAGTYNILVTDGNLCTAETSVTIVTPGEPAPVITGETELIVGESSSYAINSTIFTGNAIDSIVWTANGIVICNDPGCFDIGTQTPDITTVYEVIVYYNGTCFVAAALTVVVNEPEPIRVFEFPNVISPNNDGDNDTWEIVSNDDDIIVNSIKVYDRWGNMVFSHDGSFKPLETSVSWDGTFEGKKLLPGVYVYYVDYSDDRLANRIRTGDITIVN